jgi:hypothetical protein
MCLIKHRYRFTFHSVVAFLYQTSTAILIAWFIVRYEARFRYLGPLGAVVDLLDQFIFDIAPYGGYF